MTREEDKKNDRSTEKDSNGVPYGDTFSNKELNRLTEIKTNSSETKENTDRKP